MRHRPEFSEKFQLADLRRLSEHPAGSGRIGGLGRDSQICQSNEESGSAGLSIKEKAGSTGRPNARWVDEDADAVTGLGERATASLPSDTPKGSCR